MVAGARMIALAAAVVALVAVPAAADLKDEARLSRQAALGYADMLQAAYRRVAQHVRAESAAVTADFSAGIPPAATGWHGSWTENGVRARYCEETLVVYLAPEEVKGSDQRAVQVAPFRHAVSGDTSPPLHWLEGGVADGGKGRSTVTLPACMTGLPSGRVAVAGLVRDPLLDVRDQVSREQEVVACGAGEHGRGQTMVREVTQQVNGRNDPVGTPNTGPWMVLIDDCRANYTRSENYTVACSWYQGAPHNKTMSGTQIWRRDRSVTGIDGNGAEVVSYGAPQMVSTSCWNDPNPPLPTATVSLTEVAQTNTESCGSGYSGTRDYRRIVSTRSALFPWDVQPTVTETVGGWVLVSNSCSVHGSGGDGGGGGGGGDSPGDQEGGGANTGDCGCDGGNNGNGECDPGPGDGPDGPGDGPGGDGDPGGGAGTGEW